MRPPTQRAFLVLAVAVLLGSAPSPSLKISPRSFSEDAVLSLDVVFQSSSEITVYSWRGHIYPLLGFGLTVSARDSHGRPVVVERVAKVVPKLPHKRDTATERIYPYPEPLVIRLLNNDGVEPIAGCVHVQLDYDSTSDRSGKFRPAGLDLLRVQSNTVRVCNGGE